LANRLQTPKASPKSQGHNLLIPVSLEIAGSRNHYVLSLRALPSNVTTLNVKADFGKLAQGGRVLTASAEKVSEIERGPFREMNKALAFPSKT
jgi:hypothetical protein